MVMVHGHGTLRSNGANSVGHQNDAQNDSTDPHRKLWVWQCLGVLLLRMHAFALTTPKSGKSADRSAGTYVSRPRTLRNSMAWLPWKSCKPRFPSKAAQVAPVSSQVGSMTSTPEDQGTINTSKTGQPVLGKLTEMEIFDLETAFKMFDVDGNGAPHKVLPRRSSNTLPRRAELEAGA